MRMDDRRFRSSPEVDWRRSVRPDITVEEFCEWLLDLAAGMLLDARLEWTGLDVLGVAFPGPQRNGLWYSNNLTSPFRDGVPLESVLQRGLAVRCAQQAPEVRVCFDAQCDAGGELYDRRGRLFGHEGNATVLNLATGVAAGYVSRGRVLTSDGDFKAEIHPDFDSGMGQLGRHLWHHEDTKRWEYRPAPDGRTPSRGDDASRLTDRLGGPALAARILAKAHCAGVSGELADVLGASLLAVAKECAGVPGPEATEIVRKLPSEKVRSVLVWLNAAYIGRLSEHAERAASAFVEEVVGELASAIETWMGFRIGGEAPWRGYGRRLVLTGGVGIRLVSGADAIAEKGLAVRLSDRLPGISVERSILDDAIERESHLFYHQ